MSWSLELLEGADLPRRLRQPDALRRWRRLARRDPKPTWFQEPAFVLSWYTAHAHRWQPLAIRAVAPDGSWLGFVALATDGERVVHAGNHHAPYHGWIAAPEIEPEFAAAAAERALDLQGGHAWTWGCLPPGAPVAWAEQLGARVGEHPAPVWDLTRDDAIDRHLESGGLRDDLDRYRRAGELRLVRAFGRRDTGRALRRMAPWHDLRHGAVHGRLPFRDDPSGLDFHAELAVADGSVHTSVLQLDGRPLAVHLGGFDGERLFLGPHGHDPVEGRRSPGAILMIELARQVMAGGGHEIDLAAGDRGWTERWASDHRILHRVELVAAPRHRRIETPAGGPRDDGDALHRVGTDPAPDHGRSDGPTPTPATPARWFEVDVRIHGSPPERPPANELAAVDAPWLAELLSFGDDHDRQTTAAFLGEALRHLQRGWGPICMTGENGLLRVAWIQPTGVDGLIPRQEDAVGRLFRDGIPEGLPGRRVPDDTAMVMLTHEGTGASVEGLLSLLAEAARLADRGRLWVRVPAEHAAAGRWLEDQARPLEELPEGRERAVS